jgi:hypothetical protein
MLGLLVKKHYPGLVTIDGIQKPPNKWLEFYKVKDADEVSLVDVIKREFWVSLHRTSLLMSMHLLDGVEIMK